MERTLGAATEWAKAEFGDAELGDIRRNRRLVQLAAALAEKPCGALPGVLPSWAELKAAYRFFSQEDSTYERIASPHWQRTRDACRNRGEYLLVEDTTSLNYTKHVAAEGLGWLGDGVGRGIYLHSTLALHVERWCSDGTPEVTAVGLFAQRRWTRREPPKTAHETRAERLKRERESERWGAVFDETGGPPPGVRWTYIADRESDIYRALVRLTGRDVDFIVRANQRRSLEGDNRSVFDAVASRRVLGRFSIDLRARPGVKARTAKVSVRATSVTLRPPRRGCRRLASLAVNVVEAREVRAPAGVEPVHWVLLTSWPVETFEDAMRVVKSYEKRWLIEEYHKALKTGAGAEKSQLSKLERLEALLGILVVVAVRLLNMKLLAASRPDDAVPAGSLGREAFSILEAVCGRPPKGWTNRSALVAVARMGGFLARKRDGDPGWLTIWRGWQRLMLMVEGFSLAMGQGGCG